LSDYRNFGKEKKVLCRCTISAAEDHVISLHTLFRGSKNTEYFEKAPGETVEDFANRVANLAVERENRINNYSFEEEFKDTFKIRAILKEKGVNYYDDE
jgi:hypothetical protein